MDNSERFIVQYKQLGEQLPILDVDPHKCPMTYPANSTFNYFEFNIEKPTVILGYIL